METHLQKNNQVKVPLRRPKKNTICRYNNALMSPKNASFTKQSPINCKNCQEIYKNTLKNVCNHKNSHYFTKKAYNFACILPEVP